MDHSEVIALDVPPHEALRVCIMSRTALADVVAQRCSIHVLTPGLVPVASSELLRVGQVFVGGVAPLRPRFRVQHHLANPSPDVFSAFAHVAFVQRFFVNAVPTVLGQSTLGQCVLGAEARTLVRVLETHCR